MSEFSDDMIRASLEANGASLVDYVLFGKEGATTICVVSREKVLIGVIADDDDARFHASIAYLTKMKAPHFTTFEEMEASGFWVAKNREEKRPNQPPQPTR